MQVKFSNIKCNCIQLMMVVTAFKDKQVISMYYERCEHVPLQLLQQEVESN